MHPLKWLIHSVLAYTLCFSLLFGREEELHFADVHGVMDTILKEHLKQKTLSVQNIRNSFKLYIDQFDPKRIYLLDNEVQPYLHMSDRNVEEILSHYLKNDFSDYQKLSRLIQQSIERARHIRVELEKNPTALFALVHAKEKTTAGSLPFVKSEAQLKQQIANDISKQLQHHFRKDKADRIQGANLFLQHYEHQLQNEENRYLYVDSRGRPLPSNEKENLEVLHLLQALTKSLDAHSAFLDENEARGMKIRLEKGFKGIGVVIRERANGFVINHIVPSSPAERSGRIKVGDLIIAIDGHDVAGESLESVLTKLRDEERAAVTLQIQSENHTPPSSVTLKRELIPVNEGRAETQEFPVKDGVIGVITMDAFYQGANGVATDIDIQKAVEKLNHQGKLKGLIIDLRENGGGFLSQAVKVAGLFITKGVVVISKTDNGKEKFYRDMAEKKIYHGPLVILTSRATASAAEIVAETLQDYGVALIVGDQRTYGKGTIQSQTITDEKGSSYFKVTVGKYYTVSGHTPQGEGVSADIVVPSPYSLLKIGEEYLENTPSHDAISPAYIDPLKDVPPGMKPWYIHYYLPGLQKRETKWRTMIPELNKRSAERLAQVPDLQALLVVKSGHPPPRALDVDTLLDLELEEAVNIVKDMIQLDNRTLN